MMVFSNWKVCFSIKSNKAYVTNEANDSSTAEANKSQSNEARRYAEANKLATNEGNETTSNEARKLL